MKELKREIVKAVQDATDTVDGTVSILILEHFIDGILTNQCNIATASLSLPDSDEITEAAMDYAEIDGTTDKYDENIRGAAHFVAGADWYHKRIKGNGL
mgnify:CR=1 FL=1